jgi:hypothetical protein
MENGLSSSGATAQMDQRNVAVGPDGTTYVVAEQMGMMGGGMGDQGMTQTLYALGQDNRLLWSYRLDSGQATAPVVGSDGTVYLIVYFMSDTDRSRGDSNELRKSKLYAIRGGRLNWSYEFEARLPSAPVLGPQRTVYFSVNCSMMGAMGDIDDMDVCERDESARLVAVQDRLTSAALLWSRDVDAMMISEPVVQVSSASSWTISVSGLSQERSGMGGSMMGAPALFRFKPDGSFQTIQLGRGRGM